MSLIANKFLHTFTVFFSTPSRALDLNKNICNMDLWLSINIIYNIAYSNFEYLYCLYVIFHENLFTCLEVSEAQTNKCFTWTLGLNIIVCNMEIWHPIGI